MARDYYRLSEIPEEYAPPAPEYNGVTSAPEYDDVSLGRSAQKASATAERKKLTAHELLKKMFLAPVLGVVTVLTVASSAFGTDLISEFFGDSFGSLGTGFPILPNLEPNGYVEFQDYGVLDEEFVRFEGYESEMEYLWAGKAYGDVDCAEMEGAVYDRENNVLTLSGFDGADRVLNVNLMGNGFTIRLEGENHLGGILMWGFYYGGSLTITGDGSLFVNESGERENGILFYAEFSESCLMIERDVGVVDVQGSYAAFMVCDSTHRRGLYLAAGLRLEGGTAGELKYDYEEEHWSEPGMESHPKGNNFTIFDGSEPSTHISVVNLNNPKSSDEG